MPYPKRTVEEHFRGPGPKRILALDGGGLKGILTLGFLKDIEDILRKRHDEDPDFRLCHYFDLIAGTSTGSIIAAALALGLSVPEITEMYMDLGSRVFRKDPLRWGVVRARYDKDGLVRELKRVLGKDTTMGSDRLRTGLLVMTKRIDTGSPWPLGNNPEGKFFQAPPGADWISNGDYPLWKVVRASTAAPSYFDPERIQIYSEKGKKMVKGEFVDGGVSPFNNPALQAFMYATLEGFKVNWDVGATRLFLVSVGTGYVDPGKKPSRFAAGDAVKALTALMDDCGALVETFMQWMSRSPTSRVIDLEVGDLKEDLLCGRPLLTYLRFDQSLAGEDVDRLKPGIPRQTVKTLTEMDEPKNLALLKELGVLASREQVRGDLFPTGFDLRR